MLPIRRLALAALLVLTASGADPAGPTAADDVLGRTFQLVDGGTTTLAALHAEDGRPLLLNLWATWCAPCLEEMPDIEALHRARGDDIRVVGLNISDSPTRSAKLAEEIGITYLLGRDPGGVFVAALGAVGLPVTACVSRSGELTHVHHGQLNYDGLLAAVDEYLS